MSASPIADDKFMSFGISNREILCFWASRISIRTSHLPRRKQTFTSTYFHYWIEWIFFKSKSRYRNPCTYRQRFSYLSCIDSRHSEISSLYPKSSFAVMFVMIFSAAISRLSRDFCLMSLSAWMICNRDRILRHLVCYHYK